MSEKEETSGVRPHGSPLQLRIRRDAAKSLSRLSKKHRHQVAGRVDALKSNPKPHDSESLTGYPGWLRIDVGEYRVIYKVEGGEIFIAIIGSRNDDKVYREFRRLNIG